MPENQQAQRSVVYIAIERLPVHNIQYPVSHFPSLPGKPVIPTAHYAEALTRQIGEIMKNSSPEEKARRMLQLKLLQNHLTAANQLQELRSLNINKIKKQQQDQDAQDQDIDDFRKRAFGHTPPDFTGDVNLGDPNSAVSMAGPEPDDLGDTSPPDYYGLT